MLVSINRCLNSEEAPTTAVVMVLMVTGCGGDAGSGKPLVPCGVCSWGGGSWGDSQPPLGRAPGRCTRRVMCSMVSWPGGDDDCAGVVEVVMRLSVTQLVLRRGSSDYVDGTEACGPYPGIYSTKV